MKNKTTDEAIAELRTAVSTALNEIQKPIKDHISYLSKQLADQTEKRDGINAKRSDAIEAFSTSPKNIKTITKFKTDYTSADDGIDIVVQALELANESLLKFKTVNQQVQPPMKAIVGIIKLKQTRAALEANGKATNAHDRQIAAELNSYNNHAKRLIKTMEGLQMDDQAVGAALVTLAKSVINFYPSTSNSTADMTIDDSIYIPTINNKSIPEVAA